MRWVWKWHLFLAYLLFFSKIMHVESISFNWHLFRNTNLKYHDEIWKRRMYLASEIIFESNLAYFIFFLMIFGPNTYLASKKKKLCLYKNKKQILPLSLWNKLETLFSNINLPWKPLQITWGGHGLSWSAIFTPKY